MKLVMTLLVRDEADIVAQNIEHHLNAGVDYIVATDNGSRDGTADILAAYERAGVLDLAHEPEHVHAQDRWVTRMALRAREEFGADWVLNNDADEFWQPLEGNLKSGLEALESGVMRCPRCTLIYAHDADTSVPWPERIIYRAAAPQDRPADGTGDSRRQPHYYHAMPPKALASTAGLTKVQMGNHDVEHETMLPRLAPTVLIYHFPVRSQRQFHRKVTQGASALEANPEAGPGTGWHWRLWNQLLAETGSLHAVMQEVLPDRSRLAQDLASGILIEDTTIRDRLQALGSGQSTSA